MSHLPRLLEPTKNYRRPTSAKNRRTFNNTTYGALRTLPFEPLVQFDMAGRLGFFVFGHLCCKRYERVKSPARLWFLLYAAVVRYLWYVLEPPAKVGVPPCSSSTYHDKTRRPRHGFRRDHRGMEVTTRGCHISQLCQNRWC